MAYQPGNAANIAATATISHTSLPSHSGPIELIAVAAAGLVAADDAVQDADAEVEALQHEEAQPQDRDQDEPERDQRGCLPGSVLDGRDGASAVPPSPASSAVAAAQVPGSSRRA